MKYRKNHYVPESYLRAFAIVHPGDRNPMLWVYDKDGKEPRKQSPKDTAAINDLYTISHETLPPHALEEAFSKQESEVAPILARWRKLGAVPEIKEIPHVAYFLALLYLRNPKTAKWFEAMVEVMSAERAKALAQDETRFNRYWESLVADETSAAKHFKKEEVREKLLNFDEHFIVKVDPKHATFSPLSHADAIYDELIKMYWCLCTTSKDASFISCDSAVVVRFKKEDGVCFGGGFGHPTAEVTFPLSPSVCLGLSRTNAYKALAVSAKFVKNANRRTAVNAECYVFASELKCGLEKLVKKYAFTRQQPRLDKDEIVKRMWERAHHSEHPIEDQLFAQTSSTDSNSAPPTLPITLPEPSGE